MPLGLFILLSKPANINAQTVITTIPSGLSNVNGVDVNPTTNRIYVVGGQPGGLFNRVLAIDGVTNSVIATVQFDRDTCPLGVAVNTVTNRIYVTDQCFQHLLSVIDGETNGVVNTIPMSGGLFGVAVNSNTNRVYVPILSKDTLDVIDGETNAVIASIAVGDEPIFAAVNPVTNRIYVTNSASNDLSVIDGASNTVIATMPLNRRPFGVAVNPLTSRIYVANEVEITPIRQLGNTISVIDGETNSIITTVKVGVDPGGVGVNPTTNRIYVTSFDDNTVSVVDGLRNINLINLSVGNSPWGIGINPITNRIYVTNPSSATISVIEDMADTGLTTRVSVDSAGSEGNNESGAAAMSANGRFIAFDSVASNLVAGDTNNFCGFSGVENCDDVFVRDRDADADGIFDEAGAVSTTRVSIDSDGNQANSGSFNQAISANGRFVTFASSASNLVLGDTNNDTDVFVRDRDTDADGIFDEAGAVSTTRISLDSAGNQANNGSFGRHDISANGRFVAFESFATNLVSVDTNNDGDIFVRDRDTDSDGIFDEAGAVSTVLVSLDSAGNQGNGESKRSAISANGRFVTFHTVASNLVAGDTNNFCGFSGVENCDDVFLRDRDTDSDGIFDEAGAVSTTRVSVDSAGNEGNNFSTRPDISADGRFISFHSRATNLVSGDTNNASDVFLRDRDTDADGIFDEAGAVSTTRVSVDSAGNEGNRESVREAISANGRFVAFWSGATNLVPGDSNNFCDPNSFGLSTENCPDIFVRDRDTDGDGIFDEPGAVSTSRVSVDSAGNQGNGASHSHVDINADGRFVVFNSSASNLVPNDTNNFCTFLGGSGHCPDIFVRDRQTLDVDDDDGITNSIDGRMVGGSFVDESQISSNDFTDQHLGGTTFGTVLERAGLTITVTEEVNPAGVRLTASGAGGTAQVKLCNLVTIGLTSGDSIVVTCGSAKVEVLTGPVEATFGDNTVTLPTGSVATVSEVEPGIFEVENSSDSQATIVVNGISLTPGQQARLNTPIDIKPGSDPNSINAGSEGVIPVAILTTPTFDAANVDPFSVTLEGGTVKLKGKSGTAGSLEDVDSDGDLDLVVQITDLTLAEGQTTAVLTGKTKDGIVIRGQDTIRVIPP